MATEKCEGEGQQCCTDSVGEFIGCYVPKNCEVCDEVGGKIIKNDSDALRLECKKCEPKEDGTAAIVSSCPTDKPDCCGGNCFKKGKDCKSCNENIKEIEGCKFGEKCCVKSDGTGVGCYDPNSSANKCKKCEDGALIEKCSGSTSHCCPDTGKCIDQSCQNCDGSQKCTGDNYCCNCGDSPCCNKCEKCENGTKVSVTVSAEDRLNCLECKNGNKTSKCTAGQECCSGECVSSGLDSCKYCSNGVPTSKCTDPNKDQCCGTKCWDPINDKCGACIDGVFYDDKCKKNDPNSECCQDGSCRDTSDECTMCSSSGVVSKAGQGQVCCEKKLVPASQCCGGKNLNNINSEECCEGTPYSTDEQICCDGQPRNKNTNDCCGGQNVNPKTQECCGGNTVIDKYTQICCGGKGVTKEKGKECCENADKTSGKLYSTLCESCNNGVVTATNFGDLIIGCETCDPIKGKVDECAKRKLKCCKKDNPDGGSFGDQYTTGECYNDQNGCDSCIDGVIKSKCKGTYEEGASMETPDCCGGTCWNASKQKCKVCFQGKLENKCPTILGYWAGQGIVRSTDGKDTCCESDGRCIGGCTTCEGTGNKCSGNSVKTSCCDVDQECYNPNCETCNETSALGGSYKKGVSPIVGCTCCNDQDCCKPDQQCCDGKCCSANETCSNNKCCPKGQTNKNGVCCPKKSGPGCGYKCCPEGEVCCGGGGNPIFAKCCKKCNGNACDDCENRCEDGTCIDGQDDKICCGGTVKSKSDCAQCCGGVCKGANVVCCTKDNGDSFTCADGENCCGNTCCGGNCCNGKDCCDESCCEGKTDKAGCYSPDSCQQCKGGRVSSKCSKEQRCCGGICYNPQDCQTCNGPGKIIPYTPSREGCHCAKGSGKEICPCPTPVSWILKEMGAGLVYGSGGFSPTSVSGGDNYTYDGMPSTFTSRYCYGGNMNIIVTCNDGKNVTTKRFSSYCSTTQALPLMVKNPCC